ncbi:WD40/YVTN/BNR-like repeat-containing protein [Pseudoroseicyclus tamaricis]|uniref:Exo-alpha-sialidase n=1 Tax=Pseudoroseicyclus tamaricis TaxID=2705421 RepID=A0A6B2JVZ5_9RHOB|nr:exo-alpha-sialidase [Pseudoroseicyclus tamaricis]NDV02075.1 exo-alpha-sialidase [Pseudoroseicyclus tamaricis]
MSKDLTILVGTTKGAFLLSGGTDRSGWALSGPHCNGWPINHLAGDPQTGTIWAGGGGDFFGAGIWRSEDGGQSWELTRLTSGQMDEWAKSEPGMAEMFGVTGEPLPFGDAFKQIWSLHHAHGVLYAGTKPASLLKSLDGGRSWEKVSGLTDHPSADSWHGGAAGLVLHSIVSDAHAAAKMWVGISAAGVFATEDGGETWERRNRLSNARAREGHNHPAGPEGGDVGHCVHNIRLAPGSEDLMYQQNHHGVWRSADGGRSWDDITEGLPSPFGFPVQVHPRDPQKLWVIPLEEDNRVPLDGAAAVWSSSDGGQSWAAQREGLPQSGCFFTVLRQAMTGDTAEPAGVYFGTNSGSVFASLDEGETWQEIARHLPTVLTVEVLERP